MKKFDKYPPATPEDLARIESMCHQGRVHPLLWIVAAVLIVIGVGVYSDIVGFYEFEELEEFIEGEEEHDDDDDHDHDEDGEHDDDYDDYDDYDDHDHDDEEDLHPMERRLMEASPAEESDDAAGEPIDAD